MGLCVCVGGGVYASSLVADRARFYTLPPILMYRMYRMYRMYHMYRMCRMYRMYPPRMMVCPVALCCGCACVVMCSARVVL